MLYLRQRLLLPSLVYQKDSIIKGPPESEGDSDNGIVVKKSKPSWTKKVRLYKLDWDSIGVIKRKKHLKWAKDNWPDVKVPYVSTLPKELDNDIKGCMFALDRGYLNEIRRCSQEGVQEWNIERPFDTVIREICLEVSQSYFKVAFGLLADCVFDEETGYWKRNIPRREIASLMLYKFWCHQTGRGLLMDRKRSGWEDHYEWEKEWANDEARDRVENINRLLIEHQKQLQDAFSEIYIKGYAAGPVKK
jgi:hypothetical protein